MPAQPLNIPFEFQSTISMATSIEDFKIASLAAGFTLGFGLLTTWTAIQQTMQLTNPWRSVYIYMVWGEIVVNFILAVVAWLFLDGQITVRCVPRWQGRSC